MGGSRILIPRSLFCLRSDELTRLKRLVLTGGPCGGKTRLISELQHDPDWVHRFFVLPEVISVAGQSGVLPQEQLFQRVMVATQMALEDAMDAALADDWHLLLCHRGTLDPLAYWLDRGWSEQEFFEFTQTNREAHYSRYIGVVHLVTAADGACEHYVHWPDADRTESPEGAIRIDRSLEHAWGGHPRYICIENIGRDWATKSRMARNALTACLAAYSKGISI